MSVLSDKWIIKAAKKGLIKPFVSRQVRKGKFRAVLTVMMLEFQMNLKFTNVNSGIVDPKVFKKDSQN